jgi:capsid protein
MTPETLDIARTFADLRQDFRAAKTGRFTPQIRGISTSGSGADYHYRSEYEYLHMIERSRHYERNDALIGQAVRRLVSNVVQEGFSPDPQTGDDNLDATFKELWSEWASEADLCHSEGEFNFHQIERLTLRSAIRDGDIFHLLTDEGTLQPVEGHRPRTPLRTQRNVVNGIMLDNRARRSEVWISKEDLSVYQGVSRVGDVVKYAFRDGAGHRQVLQVYFPDRFSQRRGVTAFAPCADVIGMHDDLQFSTLVKAQLASLLVILREQSNEAAAGLTGPPIGNLQGGGITQTLEQGGVRQIPGIQAGLDYVAPPGQKVSGFSPNIPNPSFFEHSMLLLTFIAVNLDLPVQMLLLDPQRSSFSSWRGAIDQARVRFREMQLDLVNQLHRPTYSWKIRQFASQSSALRRMIGNNPNWLRHNWKRPSFAYIEPNKDAQADALQQERFLSSPRRLQGARGREWDEVVAECIADRKQLFELAIQASQELEEKYDVDISWRDILSPDFGAAPRVAAPVSSETPDKPEPSASDPEE